MIESAVRNGVSPNFDTAAAGAASTLEAATLMATDLARPPLFAKFMWSWRTEV